ncbi:hypothetical protein C8Q72DRAFT_250146 [Fomitopsis betulina]|nr:hypothetical protein C8Q72DRAFT_250146 [Fomitopsis betulina]
MILPSWLLPMYLLVILYGQLLKSHITKKPRSMLTSKTTSKPKATLSTRAANDTNLYTHSDDDQALQVLQGKRRRSESAGTKDKYIGSASSDITRGRAALVAVVPADSDTERHPKKAKVGHIKLPNSVTTQTGRFSSHRRNFWHCE